MFCQNCVTCPSIRTDPGIPPPGYSATPRSRVKGPGIRTHTGAGDTVWQPILNLYNPARSQPYPNHKYISFNNGIRGDNSGTFKKPACHYSDVIMIAMTSQITGVLIVYSTVCSGTDQRKHLTE